MQSLQLLQLVQIGKGKIDKFFPVAIHDAFSEAFTSLKERRDDKSGFAGGGFDCEHESNLHGFV